MHELFVEAKTENLDTVLEFVNKHIEHCTPKLKNQFGIVVDEIFANISAYAYNPMVGGVTVRIKVDDEIAIEFEDCGIPYNPLTNEDPDIELSAEEREIGGLGIFMVKNLMDSVEYKRYGTNNVLVIKKQADRERRQRHEN
ncbi:MAG: ATP-binding protein [Oscillospiraceae bacterium]|nr:ATP-binding protein [Oscillospiraceae bacterium]